MKIKVCGITREEDIVKLLDLRVDFIGFNLLNESKRKVDLDWALVVTKIFNSEKIKPLLDIGHLYYGENRVQEALDKWPDLLNNYKDITVQCRCASS